MFRGTIVFMLCNQGSKSEGLFPFLYEGNGSFLRLYKEGDNPFENESLKVFDGQVVDLEGDWNEKSELIVTEIKSRDLSEGK